MILRRNTDTLERLRNCLDNLDFLLKSAEGTIKESEKSVAKLISGYRDRFIEAMDDDLNAANATAVIFELVRDINRTVNSSSSKELIALAREKFMELVNVLGLLFEDRKVSVDTVWIEKEISRRAQAKKDKDYALADQIREYLKEKGVILEDTPQGVKWRII